jgi:hypothetical protein
LRRQNHARVDQTHLQRGVGVWPPQEIGHGRDITWTLRAKEAPEHIREAWLGTSWIVEVATTGTRDGKPFNPTPLSHQPQHNPRRNAATCEKPLEH